MSNPEVEKNLRILVVDDNHAIHEDFRKILCAGPVQDSALEQAESLLFDAGAKPATAPRRLCFEVDSAFQGQEGLEKARLAKESGRPYAMAFVDVRMPPGWDGIETTARIWEICPDLQIVICTAYSDYSWEEMSAKLSNSDQVVILKKPFDTVEVLQLAAALTEKWRLHQQARVKLDQLEQLVQERTRVLQNTNARLEEEAAERQRATAALRASEERYQLLFRKNPLPMWVVDLENLAFLAVNETAIREYGHSEEEFLAMSIKGIRAPEELAGIGKDLELARKVSPCFFKTKHRKKNGQIIDVEIVASGIDYGGRTAKLAVVNDVTARKSAEDRVREQAALLDLAHDAIFVRDLEGRITFWNKGAERLYGWTAAETAGKTTSQLFPGGGPVAVGQAEQEILEHGEWSGEFHRRTRENREITIDSRWTLLRDEQSNPRSVLVIEADVTEKKKLETQFLRAQRMEGIGTLATGMAHDLNNILAPILISAGTLRWELAPEEREDAIKHIEAGVKRGAEVIRQVLTFGRGVEGERVAVNPADLLRETALIVSQTFPKDITIVQDVAADVWPIIGDKTQIHQVLLNLCINARDAMPEGGQLTLSIHNVMVDEHYHVLHAPGRPGPYVVFEVADTGCGIAPGDMERIFDPFFTTKEFGKGTGLGLSTVLGIVKSHQGLLAVDTALKKGTTFKALFPVSAKASNSIVSKIQLPAPRGEGQAVLIIDDEVNIVATNRRMLEKHGYRVLTANNGQQALEVYKLNRPDIELVVTDIMMPNLDGMGLIRALKAMNPEIKIIASSGLGSGLGNVSGGDNRASELNDLGVNAFLSKPYQAEKLLGVINEVLKEKREPVGAA
jgi:two-component system, cell cycle sensor histidine kinase and response regulator CckA